jgi:hypothetical protein
MRTTLKIVLILAGFIVFFLLYGIAKAFSGGIASLISVLLIVGFFAGAKAIWKYNPDKNENNDKHELDKK